MSYIKDKYGILLPPSAYGSGNFTMNDESTTRVYTTKDGEPMVESEFKQCLDFYKKEFGFYPRTAVVPASIYENKSSIEKQFNLIVKSGSSRPNGITLTSV